MTRCTANSRLFERVALTISYFPSRSVQTHTLFGLSRSEENRNGSSLRALLRGRLGCYSSHLTNVGESFVLGGRQLIVLDKSCESMASPQKRLTVCSMAVSLSCMPHMRTWKVRYFSRGYLGFEARRSSLSNAQIMTNASPAPAIPSNTATFASMGAPHPHGSVRERLAPNTRCARLGISPASSYARTRSMKAGEVRLRNPTDGIDRLPSLAKRYCMDWISEEFKEVPCDTASHAEVAWIPEIEAQ